MAVRFKSWVKEGFAASAASFADQNGLPTLGHADLPITLRLTDRAGPIRHRFQLAGPGDIATLDSAAVLRTVPEPGSRDCEPNFFLYVEFADPALPWQYTPAIAGRNQRLAPWLVLAVLEEGEGLALLPGGKDPNYRLSIAENAGKLLPDPLHAYNWAHVEEGDATIARIVSPARMRPNRSYLACLVPLFEAGRRIGLGRDVGDAGAQTAWTHASGALDLSVYHHWRFRSGAADFEQLALRLAPLAVDRSIGLHDLDLTRSQGGLDIEDVLPGENGKDCVLVSFAGALTAPEPLPRSWPRKHAVPYRARLAAMLTDPVIAAPAGGRSYDALNGDPVHRAAAGLGARVVARHQEEFVAEAWVQLAVAQEARTVLRNARYASATAVRLHRKVASLDPVAALQVAQRIHDIVFLDSTKWQRSIVAATASGSADAPLTAEFRRLSVCAGKAIRSAERTSGSKPVNLAKQGARTTLAGEMVARQSGLRAVDGGVRSIELGAWRAVSAAGPSARTERAQSVVPMSKPAAPTAPVETAGALKSAAMAQTDRFSFESVEAGSAALASKSIEDWFALAEFERMSDEDRITSPSFVELASGAVLSSGAQPVGPSVLAEDGFEEIIVDPLVNRRSASIRKGTSAKRRHSRVELTKDAVPAGPAAMRVRKLVLPEIRQRPTNVAAPGLKRDDRRSEKGGRRPMVSAPTGDKVSAKLTAPGRTRAGRRQFA